MSRVSSNPSTRAPDSESVERISLAGRPTVAPIAASGGHEALALALDDAVDKLSQVTDTDVTLDAATLRRTATVFPLIEAMSTDSSRRQAAQRLADFISDRTGGAAVRCGLGSGRLVHLYDCHLGWLGAESSLHQQAAEKWDPPRRRESDPKPDQARVVDREGVVQIALPQPNGTGRCVVWVQPENEISIEWIKPVVSVIGTVLWSRPRRSWPRVTMQMARHTTISLAAAGILLLVLAVWPVHYRVACTARVETSQQRLVATPFEATLLSANVRPGDAVKAGQVLLTLDGRPLRLEREAIEAELQQVSKEHDVALATRRIADAQQTKLRMQQLSRQHDLLNDRLRRLEVVSPIDGIVVSGDLEKFVGSPLERGQTLIEVAPMDQMIIEVEIPEHEIAYVKQGADVRIKLDAIGGQSMRLPLSEVFPSAEVREDRNVFVGRIEVDNDQQDLRPGMRGEATTYGPLRPWIWSWVRGAFERILWWSGY